ncbi:MAG: GNAT family N-acetyltransferase [Bacteroidota bacterium]|nr:GNAT family N-acetyltransferase [Bacteroidota bacterium]
MQPVSGSNVHRTRRLRYALRVRTGALCEAYDLLIRMPELQPLPSFDALKAECNGHAPFCLIAEANGRPAACAVGYAVGEKRFFSCLGGVLPEYRRCGIARTLLEEQECYLFERGYRRIELRAPLDEEPIYAFLEEEGYTRVGVESSQQGQKLLYEKRLSPRPVPVLQPLPF